MLHWHALRYGQCPKPPTWIVPKNWWNFDPSIMVSSWSILWILWDLFFVAFFFCFFRKKNTKHKVSRSLLWLWDLFQHHVLLRIAGEYVRLLVLPLLEVGSGGPTALPTGRFFFCGLEVRSVGWRQVVGFRPGKHDLLPWIYSQIRRKKRLWGWFLVGN